MKSILMKTLWMAWKMIAPCRLTSRAPALMSVGTNIIALAFLFVAGAAAQQPQATLDSNAIMGFETPSGWTAKGDPDFGTTLLSATTIRTQGSFALQVKNPGDAITLTSLPVASTAEALEGVGDAGAFFDVDVMLPNHAGLLQLLVSSNSRGLHNVQIGKVQFTGLRLGIYTTLKFPIPDQVSDALAGRSFNDLTFQFILTLPEQETSPGTLRFDNLRVHSAPLVQSPTGTPPPPGYGGSVNLVVFGDAPVTQTFNLGPAQIPNSFHLKLRTVGTTTVELQLGLDGKPTLTCTYDHDATDPAGQFYILDSCADGFQAGDLVNANWVHMAIVNGNRRRNSLIFCCWRSTPSVLMVILPV